MQSHYRRTPEKKYESTLDPSTVKCGKEEQGLSVPVAWGSMGEDGLLPTLCHALKHLSLDSESH